MTGKSKKSNSWPIRPHHLTKGGESLGLKGTGIITNRHLQGHQSEISDIVGQPTAIIEFALDGSPIRTDSPFLDLALNPACQLFRRENPEVTPEGKLKLDKDGSSILGAACLCCDNCHARLFYNLHAEELRKNIINERKDLYEFQDLRKLYKGISDHLTKPTELVFEWNKLDERLFLEYDCPLLGFRDLLFPVIFEERVIAAFFVGGLTLDGQQTFVNDMILSVHKRHPGCFETSTRPHNIIVQDILKKHQDWLNENPCERIIDKDTLDTIKRTTIKELKDFEIILDNEMQHQRIAYIRTNISSELKEFATQPKDTGDDKADSVDDAVLKPLWDRVEASMKRLAEYFSFKYALVFGTSRIVHQKQDQLTVQAKIHSHGFTPEQLAALKLDITKFPPKYTVCCPKGDGQNRKYLEALHGCDLSTLGDFQLVLVPTHPHPLSSIGVLLGYGDGFPSDERENAPDADMHRTLQSFFTFLVSTLAATLARGAEDLAKRQLLYLGHEAGQLAAGLDWLRLTYEDTRGAENSLREKYMGNKESVIRGLRKKLEDLCADIKGYPGQMAFFFDIARRLATDDLPKAVPTLFRPYGDVLGKWKDTYRTECDKKRLQLRVVDPQFVLGSRENDPWRPTMYSDKFLFEQVVYNLVNNAEKYCYRGTKIHMDCKLRDLNEEIPRHVLTVTDYGRYMLPGREVYLPFRRFETYGDVEGLGLGLYIAWLIVETVFGGEIKHFCDPKDAPVSKFNVPLIAPYINRSFEGKDDALVADLKEELGRLRKARLYNFIIAYESETEEQKEKKKPRYEPSSEELRNEIKSPTYKVTIEATIPKYGFHSQAE